MRRIHRRLDILEKAMAARRLARQTIAHRALDWLPPHEVDLLLSASGADRQGRPLSEPETAARQAYRAVFEREWRRAGYSSTKGFDGKPDIGRAVLLAAARRIGREDLDLAAHGHRAEQQGRTASERESAAMAVCNLEWARLWQRAGFSVTEKVDRGGGGQC